MNQSNWDDLILSLESSLNVAKRLKSYYSAKTEDTEIPLFEGLSVSRMLEKIAEANGGKLVVKAAIRIIAANLRSDRETANNNIYSALYTSKTKFKKLSPGVYQLIGK